MSVLVGEWRACMAGFPPDSIWYNRDIVDRVQVEWGRHSLVTATRNLMKVALQEPLNRKLILLSEAGIPLYPPTALYYQLITEDKSRINSCTLPGVRPLLLQMTRKRWAATPC